MSVFTRQNLLVLTAVFTATDQSGNQPSAANAYVSYKDISGVQRRDTVGLTVNATTKVWSGVWDSTNSGVGDVDWTVLGTGLIQAAAQGSFQIIANSANIP